MTYPTQKYIRVPDDGVVGGFQVDDLQAAPMAPLILQIGPGRYLSEDELERCISWAEAEAITRRRHGFSLNDRRTLEELNALAEGLAPATADA
jgi:hypothetical protein